VRAGTESRGAGGDDDVASRWSKGEVKDEELVRGRESVAVGTMKGESESVAVGATKRKRGGGGERRESAAISGF
jgi:hypothetical protein